MPLYEAKGNIDHNHVAYQKGAVVELPADEVKSDMFVLVKQPAPVVVEPVSAPADAPLPKSSKPKADAKPVK